MCRRLICICQFVLALEIVAVRPRTTVASSAYLVDVHSLVVLAVDGVRRPQLGHEFLRRGFAQGYPDGGARPPTEELELATAEYLDQRDLVGAHVFPLGKRRGGREAREGGGP